MLASKTLSSCSCRPFAAGRPSVQPKRSVAARSTGWSDPAQNRAEKALWGENFGARDPTAGELASNFSDKVLGNFDTSHIIKVPSKVGQYVGIGAQVMKPQPELSLLHGKEFDLIKNQVPGWKVITTDGKQSLRQEWRAKDAAAAAQIAKRLADVAASEGYTPAGINAQGDIVIVELTNGPLAGLTLNDFIIASRMNDTDVKDLQAQKRVRYWA